MILSFILYSVYLSSLYTDFFFLCLTFDIADPVCGSYCSARDTQNTHTYPLRNIHTVYTPYHTAGTAPGYRPPDATDAPHFPRRAQLYTLTQRHKWRAHVFMCIGHTCANFGSVFNLFLFPPNFSSYSCFGSSLPRAGP